MMEALEIMCIETLCGYLMTTCLCGEGDIIPFASQKCVHMLAFLSSDHFCKNGFIVCFLDFEGSSEDML